MKKFPEVISLIHMVIKESGNVFWKVKTVIVTSLFRREEKYIILFIVSWILKIIDVQLPSRIVQLQ